jgi:hypothetical protein
MAWAESGAICELGLEKFLMHSELWNLSLFALAIGKAAGMTLLGPGIFSVYAVEKWASANRVPARKQGERWLAWRKSSSLRRSISRSIRTGSTSRALTHSQPLRMQSTRTGQLQSPITNSCAFESSANMQLSVSEIFQVPGTGS